MSLSCTKHCLRLCPHAREALTCNFVSASKGADWPQYTAKLYNSVARLRRTA